MYYLVFLILLSVSLLEVRNKNRNVKHFYFCYFILLLMVTLRQGQGSDYYNYLEIYKEVEHYSNESFLLLFLKGDPGFLFINYFAQLIGIEYKFFSAIFSFITMLLAYPFFSKHCNKSVIPLFFFYTTFYLIYPYSAIRQGFALAILLGIMYSYLIEKRYSSYYLFAILATTIHLSAIVVFIFPFIYNKKISRNFLLLICLCSFSFLFVFNPFENITTALAYGRLDAYIESGSSTKYLAVIVRLLIIIPIFLIPERIYYQNQELNNLRKIIISGFFFYSIFSFSELASSRIETYFRIFEGIFITKLIHEVNLKKISYQIFYCYTLLGFVLFTKNINSFIIQGNYQNCTVITYPYLSLFDSEETIMYYRKNLGFADRIE